MNKEEDNARHDGELTNSIKDESTTRKVGGNGGLYVTVFLFFSTMIGMIINQVLHH